eukprot:scaffold4642_cov45-Isochrysis_galbana.AAC.1
MRSRLAPLECASHPAEITADCHVPEPAPWGFLFWKSTELSISALVKQNGLGGADPMAKGAGGAYRQTKRGSGLRNVKQNGQRSIPGPPGGDGGLVGEAKGARGFIVSPQPQPCACLSPLSAHPC